MKERGGTRKTIYEIAKGTITAVLVTLAAVLLFALILDLSGADDKIVRPVDQVIKTLSVFCGCLAAIRGDKGWLKGIVIGVAASLLSAVLFGFVGGEGGGFGGMLIDALCAAIVGAVSGILIVNFVPFAREDL